MKRAIWTVMALVALAACVGVLAEGYVPDISRAIELQEAERRQEAVPRPAPAQPAATNTWYQKFLAKTSAFYAKAKRSDFEAVPTPLRSNVWIDVGYSQHYAYDSNPLWTKNGKGGHYMLFNPYVRMRYFGTKTYLENLFDYRYRNYLGTLSGRYNLNNYYDRFIFRYDARDDVSLGFDNMFSAGDEQGATPAQYVFNRSRVSGKWQVNDKLAVQLSPFASVYHDTAGMDVLTGPGAYKGYSGYNDFNDVGGNASALYEPLSDLRFLGDMSVYYRNFWQGYATDYIAFRPLGGVQWDFLRSAMRHSGMATNALLSKADINHWKLTGIAGVETRAYMKSETMVEYVLRMAGELSLLDRRLQFRALYRHDIDDTVILPDYVPFTAFDSYGDVDNLLATPASVMTLNSDYNGVRYDDVALQTALYLFKSKRLALVNSVGCRYNDYMMDRRPFTGAESGRTDEMYWYIITGIRYRLWENLWLDATYTFVNHNISNRGDDYREDIFSTGFNLYF